MARKLHVRLSKLFRSHLDRRHSDLHATVLSEFWQSVNVFNLMITKYSFEVHPAALPDDDSIPDFLTEAKVEVIHLEEHIKQLRKTIQALENIPT